MKPLNYHSSMGSFGMKHVLKNKLVIFSLLFIPLALLFYLNSTKFVTRQFSFLPLFLIFLTFQTLFFSFEFVYVTLLDSKQSIVYQRIALTRIGFTKFGFLTNIFFLFLTFLSHCILILFQTFLLLLKNPNKITMLGNGNLPMLLILNILISFFILNLIFFLHNLAQTRLWQNIIKGIGFFIIFSILFIFGELINLNYLLINTYFEPHYYRLFYLFGAIIIGSIVILNYILYYLNKKRFNGLP